MPWGSRRAAGICVEVVGGKPPRYRVSGESCSEVARLRKRPASAGYKKPMEIHGKHATMTSATINAAR